MSFLRRVAKTRPPRARHIPDEELDHMGRDRGSLGGYADTPPRSSLPAASRELAAIMSEQQSIISALRDLQRGVAVAQDQQQDGHSSTEEILCSAEFQAVVGRLQQVQWSQRNILGGDRQRVSASEQRTLVRQTEQMMALLSQLMEYGEPQPAPSMPLSNLTLSSHAGSSCSASNSSNQEPVQQWQPQSKQPPPSSAPPQLQPSVPEAALPSASPASGTPPALIDFSLV